jgi:hypothetical protein
MSKINKCRACKKSNLKNLFSLGNQNFTGIFPIKKNLNVPSGKLNLVMCGDCRLVQLDRNFSLKKMYGKNYGYRTGLNKSMVTHIYEKVDSLKSKIELKKNDLVIDIGSNDGTLLNYINNKKLKLIAVDPTIKKFSKYYNKNVIKISNFFSLKNVKRKTKKQKAKLITSIAMFYDLPDPVKFAKDIYSCLDDNGIWHLEQSYSKFMLEKKSYDTICHEHLEYYSIFSLNNILKLAGLKIIDVSFNKINGGSFAITAAKKNSLHKEYNKLDKLIYLENKNNINSPSSYKLFFKKISENKRIILKFFKKVKKQKKKVFGYGASTKGNVILQFCKIKSDEIQYICDVNKDKHGSYTPGSKIKIISEKNAKKMNVDYFFVLPWHFKKFIFKKEKLNKKKNRAKFVFPLPNFRIF